MEAFEKLVSMLDYPMYVVTTRAGDESGGLPRRVHQPGQHRSAAVSGRPVRARTTPTASHRQATHLAVHLLPRTHRELARLFGSETGDQRGQVRALRVAHRPARHAGPDDAAGWFVGEVLDRHDLGDHVGLLVKPVAGDAPDEFDQLVTFADVRDLEPGHEA